VLFGSHVALAQSADGAKEGSAPQGSAAAATDSLARATIDGRTGEFGSSANARFMAAFPTLPVAVGGWFTTGDELRRYMAAIAVAPVNGVSFTFSGQRVEESSRSALSLDRAPWLNTNSLSSGMRVATPFDGISFVANADYWTSPSKLLIDNTLFSVNFLGVSGYRVAGGIDWAISPTLAVRATAGTEQATRNGVNGFFGTIDLRKRIDAWTFSVGYWTSPNFGDGLQAGVDYAFAGGLTMGVFGGFQKSATDKPYIGIRMSVPLAPPTDFKGSAQLVADLDQHMTRMVNTMPGMPTSAKKKAIRVENKIVFFLQTVYGDRCTTDTPTPGCTFDGKTGARITVDRDGDYNRAGHGTDDLWYVKFDSAGNAAVYNDLGQFQYYADVSTFAGYVSGTTIGVGTTGFYWENVANGTYWLGQNGVLYSANVGESRYAQAIN
jgi:hypothetical protein